MSYFSDVIIVIIFGLKDTLANLKNKFSHVTMIPSPEKSRLIADDNFTGS